MPDIVKNICSTRSVLELSSPAKCPPSTCIDSTIAIDWANVTIGTPTSGWTVQKSTEKSFKGRTSLKVTATAGAADTLTCTITLPASVFLGGAERICFPILALDSAITGSDTYPIQLWFKYSGSTTHRMQGFVYPSYCMDTWNEAVLFDQDASGSGHISGTVQWAKVASEEIVDLTLVMTKAAGQAITNAAYIGPVYTDPIKTTLPMLTIFMDGQYSGQYKYAQQVHAAYGIKSSLAVLPPWIGTVAGTMSLDQLRIMYDYGHEFIHHTGTAGNFGWDNTTKYPDGSEFDLVKADIQASQTWMKDNNFTRGLGYGVVGFTNGLSATQTIDRRTNISNAIRSGGLVKVRQLSGHISNYYGVCGENDVTVTTSQMVTSSTATATVTALVDKIIARGGWSGLTFHDFKLSGATGNDYNIGDFETVIDYIATKVNAGVLKVELFSDAMKKLVT